MQLLSEGHEVGDAAAGPNQRSIALTAITQVEALLVISILANICRVEVPNGERIAPHVRLMSSAYGEGKEAGA